MSAPTPEQRVTALRAASTRVLNGQITTHADTLREVFAQMDRLKAALAEAERRGAEQALREAGLWIERDSGRHSGAGIAEWLYVRADAIARGEL